MSAEELVTVLEPELHRCESDLHTLLPELLQQRGAAFLRRLSEAQAGLEVFPSSAQDLEKHLTFVNNFDSHRRVLDRDLDDVEAHYELCKVLVFCARQKTEPTDRSVCDLVSVGNGLVVDVTASRSYSSASRAFGYFCHPRARYCWDAGVQDRDQCRGGCQKEHHA